MVNSSIAISVPQYQKLVVVEARSEHLTKWVMKKMLRKALGHFFTQETITQIINNGARHGAHQCITTVKHRSAG